MTTNNAFETELSSLVWGWMPETAEDGFEHVHNIWPALVDTFGPLPEIEALLDEDDAFDAYAALAPMIETLPVEQVMRIIGDLDENNRLTMDYPDGLRGYLTDCFSDYVPGTWDEAALESVIQRIQGA